jgi:hypothetical protein
VEDVPFPGLRDDNWIFILFDRICIKFLLPDKVVRCNFVGSPFCQLPFCQVALQMTCAASWNGLSVKIKLYFVNINVYVMVEETKWHLRRLWLTKWQVDKTTLD